MSNSELPQYELYISTLQRSADSLFVRLNSEYFRDPEGYGRAFDVEIAGCSSADALHAFLEAAKSRGDYVYVQSSEGELSIRTEDEDLAVSSYSRISVSEDELNSAEIRSLVDNLKQWHDNEHSLLVHVNSIISETRTKVTQQMDRIKLKAAGHDEGVASTLYRQQMEFLQKVLDQLGRKQDR